MINFIGTYECKLGAKGRLPLPSGIRKQFPEDSTQFVLKRSVFQPCLELYPLEEWNKVMAKLSKLNRFVKKNNDFIRLFTAGVKPVEIDENGRIQIAKDLTTFAQLEKELVISSAVNIIEIWDKNLYEQSIASGVEDFATLAEEVMGQINLDELS